MKSAAKGNKAHLHRKENQRHKISEAPRSWLGSRFAGRVLVIGTCRDHSSTLETRSEGPERAEAVRDDPHSHTHKIFLLQKNVPQKRKKILLANSRSGSGIFRHSGDMLRNKQNPSLRGVRQRLGRWFVRACHNVARHDKSPLNVIGC